MVEVLSAVSLTSALAERSQSSAVDFGDRSQTSAHGGDRSQGSALGGLERLLRTALARQPASHGRGLLVAFSGGPDSTALLLAARRLAARRDLPLWAIHVDHGLDADSPRRARAAQRLADQLGVPCLCRSSARGPRPGRSVEAEARAERYRLLEHERRRLDAAWILTAHHRQDQLETLLLRIRQGSGLRGLRGIRSRLGGVLRPLLEADRALLRAALAEHPELTPVLDPTNDSLAHARNRVRHRLLPALSRGAGTAPSDLAGSISRLASSSRRRIDLRLEAAVELRCATGDRLPSLSVERLLTLPDPLRHWCVALLGERSGESFPPSRRAVAELLRQLERHGRARCDWGPSKSLEASGGRLRFRNA
ncbi:MAG TPA: tRNA lysidine(34) synthetase TilS [Thermoanaerobaculia bacterium]|nr:tRNA lysidine(34) synthetase TilS [Thermoanaerobaculia bacterium]